MYALVASVRPKEIKPLVRFEGLPGEFSQHDFGEVEVAFLDGSSRRIHFFASRLKYSRLIRVSVVQDQTVESLVRNLAEHLDDGDSTCWIVLAIQESGQAEDAVAIGTSGIAAKGNRKQF